MKKIKYAIEEEIEVDDNATDKDIDNIIAEISKGKDYLWTYGHSILDNEI